MNQKIGIVGCGHVGSDLAFSLVTQGICSEIILFDQAEEKVASEAMELRDMLSAVQRHTKIVAGGTDYTLLADADLIVMAIGPTTLLREDRMEELKETSAAVRSIVPQIMKAGFDGIFMNITNPCDVITQIIAKESGLGKERVFGTGTALDTMRMRSTLGEHFDVAPTSITGYVLGEHGESQFIAWSSVRLANEAVEKRFSLAEQEMLKEQVRARGWNILLGKGWTSFGIATAAAELISIVLRDAHEVMPVSVYDEKRDVYVGRPAILNKSGIKEVLSLADLTIEELERYEKSCLVIKQAFHEVYSK